MSKVLEKLLVLSEARRHMLFGDNFTDRMTVISWGADYGGEAGGPEFQRSSVPRPTPHSLRPGTLGFRGCG